jgi:prophage antirepressor-like protein
MSHTISQIKKTAHDCVLDAVIISKIACHTFFDRKKNKATQCDLTADFVKTLVARQPNCAICDEPMTSCIGKKCGWQWSIDRIDNSKGHTVDNIRLTCYYCNVRQYGTAPSNEEARLMKRTVTCAAGCHIASASRSDPGLANIGKKLRRCKQIMETPSAVRNMMKGDFAGIKPVIDTALSSATHTHAAVDKGITEDNREDSSVCTVYRRKFISMFNGIKVRIVGSVDEPFFYASDLFNVLKISHGTRVLSKLDPGDIVTPEQRATHKLVTFNKGTRQVNNTIVLLTESGVRHVITKAKCKEASEFRAYIFGLLKEERLAEKEQLILHMSKQIEALKAKNDALEREILEYKQHGEKVSRKK